MIFVTEPYTYSSTAIQATHGSPYSYDTHVPLIIFGNGIKSGRYLQPGSTASAAVRAGVAAPFRLVQRPFRHTDVGVGFVVSARVSERTPA